MNILKKLALGILSPLFIVLLFTTAFDIGFVHTATHPATVKKLIAESGIYDSVIPAVLQQTKSISTDAGNINPTDPTIQKAANATITPAFIQKNTEGALDSVYKWLDGDIAQPDFKIDLTGVKDNFADNISSSVQQRLAGLPACSADQDAAIAQGGQFDAINTDCLPQGVTPEAAATEVKNSLSGGKDFLENTTLSANNIKGANSNQSFFQTDKSKNIPKQYQHAKKTPLVLSILTILAGVGIVFLSSTWQKGLRHIGINLVVIGLLMLALSYAFNSTVSTQVVPKITLDNTILQTDVRNLATDIAQQIDKNYWFFGSLYTVLGVGGIVTAEVFRRRNQPTVAKAEASSDKDDVADKPVTPKPKKPSAG